MSKIRIRNHLGRDVVVVDMNTGKLELLDGESVDDAAKTFWEAVEAIARHVARTSELARPSYRDLVFGARSDGSYDGDVLVNPGLGHGPNARGGDVNIVWPN